ncbi:hypothetical protein MTR67_018454 [Solanum verrucosum]|uniref:Uncharacterized protein n=1 Tax=Solanum verrucosum TaxID=315347 RepID=A0AAF0QS79_SOLVR|nr:hypothetical protein MTR67_018454 [Solanum verrucosum]
MDNKIQKLKTDEDNLKSKASQQHDYKNAELRRSEDGKNPELKGDDGKLLKTHNVCLHTAAVMATITILVMHSGKWNGENCYVDYTIEGIDFKEHTSYEELYNVISNQVCVDMTAKKMKLEYKVEESKTPRVIHNDMSVRVVGAICTSGIEDIDTRYMTIEELVEPLDSFVSGEFNVVILDPSQKFVEEDQVYMDKDTLKAVLDDYAIVQQFQFNTKWSNSIK